MLRTALTLLAATAVLSTQPAPPRFAASQLAEGIHLIAPTAPLGLGMEPNSLVVVGDNGVLVVDAQFSASSAREVIAAVKRITPRPVRWLVNTHWHDDHISGNATWRAAYPGLSIIAHETARTAMQTDGAKNRAGFLKSGPGTIAFLNDRIAKRTGIDGQPTDQEELDAYAAYNTLIARFAAESLATRPVLPDVLVRDALTLHVGTHRVDIRFLGKAHTASDIVVHLPDDGIIASGDIVVLPVPFVGSTSFPREYGATLDRLLALPHTRIVPGHGPVLRDDEYVRQARAMLGSIRTQVDSMRLAGDSLAVVRRTVTLAPFRAWFAGTNKLKNTLFVNYVLQSAIPKAFADGATP